MFSFLKSNTRKAVVGVMVAAVAAGSFTFANGIGTADAASGCQSVTLREGSTNGACVKVMKNRLNIKLHAAYNIDGPNGPVFGAGTAADVRRFQIEFGVRPADGVVGPKTWAALYDVTPAGQLGAAYNGSANVPTLSVWGRAIATNCPTSYMTIDASGNNGKGYSYKVWMANGANAEATVAVSLTGNGAVTSAGHKVRANSVGVDVVSKTSSVRYTGVTVTVYRPGLGTCSGSVRI